MGAAWFLRGLWDRLTAGDTPLKVARAARMVDAEGVVGCILPMVAIRALAQQVTELATKSAKDRG